MKINVTETKHHCRHHLYQIKDGTGVILRTARITSSSGKGKKAQLRQRILKHNKKALSVNPLP